jgi:multiple sugar transport system ATP-binding protein
VITRDIEELLVDTGQSVSSLGDKTHFVARVSPDIRVKHGDTVELVVDTSKLHFFDPKTGDRIGVSKPVAAGV